MLARFVENQLRDALRGGIAVEQVHRLAHLLQRSNERIVLPQDHLVIELLIDPALDDAFDVAEVSDHVAAVESGGPDMDLDNRVVPVRVLAHAVVIHQSMAVAELDPLGHGVHRPVMLSAMPTAVLFSAGLDSAVLAAAEARNGRVHPIYVSCGLAWEAQELEAVARLLAAPVFDA